MEQIQRGLEAFLEKEIEVMDAKSRTPAAEGAQGQRGESLPRQPQGQRGESLRGGAPEQRTASRSGQLQGRGNLAGELPEWDLSGGLSDEEAGIEEQEAGDERESVYSAKRPPDDWDSEEEDSEDWDSGIRVWNMRQGRLSGESASGRRQAPRSARDVSLGAHQAYSSAENSAGGGMDSRDSREQSGRSMQERRPERKRAQESKKGIKSDKKRSAPQRSAERQVSAGDSAEETMEENMRGSKRNSAAKPSKKKGSRLMAKLRRLLIAAVLIIALLGFGLYQLVGFAYGKMTFREMESMASLPMKEQGVVNILLIGNDSRENGEDGRSDAMILLSISNRTKKIYMTSLLRDIYVEIPGYDDNRLNAAYSFGGAELLMETIEKNFDIPVHRYLLVNFEAFAGLVDAVGGVDLELTTDEIVFVNGYLSEYNRLTNRPEGTDNMDVNVSGMVHLNGPQALAYSRNRYIGTDFGRTERQRKVLTEVIGKLPKAVLTNAGGLIDGLMSNLTTNLTQFECFRLSLMAGKLLTYEIVSDSIPQPGTFNNATIRNMAVLELDFEANIRYLKEKIYEE